MTEEKKNKEITAAKPRKKAVDVMVSQAIERILAETAEDPSSAKTKVKSKAKTETKPRQRKVQKSTAAAAVKLGDAEPKKTAKSTAGKNAAKSTAKSTVKSKRMQSPRISISVNEGSEVTASAVKPKKSSDSSYKLRVIPLGGLGEVGKNMTLIEYGNDIIVVDGGLAFPDDDMFGIDLVIPDHTYLIEHKENVRGYLLTHGHEDHIGGMPYILKNVPAPVYGSSLTLGLLKGKLAEHKVKADLHTVEPRQELNLGPFKVEFIRVTHSIPDSFGLAVHTPIGVILFVSDFKMDMSPIDGKQMDFGRISALGEKGVLLMMSDSTNVEKDGFSQSERSIGYNFDRIFTDCEGRIILTCFASHVHRVQQAIWAAHRTHRKVAVCGRGMQNMVQVAVPLGYLEIPDGLLIDIDKIGKYPPHEVLVLTTGSQGEPLSGLTRMASGEHRQVQIMPGDTVVISATPIPGNERTVSRTVDNLFRLGATVIYERNQGIHVSGHASRDELKMLLNMVKPRFFLPIHGEYRMLYKHAQLAQEVGMPAENTIVMENGQVLELSRKACRVNKTVTSGRILIDGFGVGDVGNSVLRERRQLSESGVIIVNMIYTKNKGKEPKVLIGPEISSQGFIFEKEYEHIIGEMKEKVLALATPERLASGSLHDLRNQVRSVVTQFVVSNVGRKPVIMVVINEV